MKIERENVRQADFIEVAIHKVSTALRDGAILVILILFVFLGSVQGTSMTALALPLSLLTAILMMSLFRISINTMPPGGLITSTFLNMIVVPVLFAKWGERARDR